MLLVTTILCAALALLASSPAQASTTLAKLRNARHDLRVATHHLLHYRGLLRALLAAQAAEASGTQTPAPTPEPTGSPATIPDPLSSPTPAPDPLATPAPAPDPSSSPTPLPGPLVSPDPPPAPLIATTGTSLTEQQLRTRIVKTRVQVRRLRHRVHRLRHRLYVERCTSRGYYMPLIRDVVAGTGVNASSVRRLMSLESGGLATAVGGGGAYCGLFQYSSATWQAAWNPWRSCSIFDATAQIRATVRAVRLGYAPLMWPNTYWRAF